MKKHPDRLCVNGESPGLQALGEFMSFRTSKLLEIFGSLLSALIAHGPSIAKVRSHIVITSRYFLGIRCLDIEMKHLCGQS